MGRAMRKRAFGHMRTAKAQISLRIRAVWSGSSLSANRIISYYRMYEWRANTKMILFACAGWSESLYFANDRRHYFAWRGPYKTVQLPNWVLPNYVKWSSRIFITGQFRSYVLTLRDLARKQKQKKNKTKKKKKKTRKKWFKISNWYYNITAL